MEEPFSKDLEDKDLKDNKQNSCLSIKLVVALLIIIGILIAVIVVLVVFIILKGGNDKDKNIETKSDEEEPKLENRIILFQQPKETDSAKHIIIHIPEKEIFMSTLHPAASLYEAVTDDVKVKQCLMN